MFCHRGSEFFLLAFCVSVVGGGGGRGVRFSTSPSVKKVNCNLFVNTFSDLKILYKMAFIIIFIIMYCILTTDTHFSP